MSQNSLQYSSFEDELNFSEIVRIIVYSKKLIISSIFIFTVISVIFSLYQNPSFKSIGYIKIGEITSIDGTSRFLESPDDLISNLEIDIVIKENLENTLIESVDIEVLSDKLIEIELISESSEVNEKILADFVSYAEKRHSNKFKILKNDLLRQIEINQIKIDHFENKLSEVWGYKYLEDSREVASEDIKLGLSLNVDFREDQLFKVSMLNRDLEVQLESLNNQPKTLLLNDIKTTQITAKTIVIVSIGSAFGLIAGIFLAIFTNRFKYILHRVTK